MNLLKCSDSESQRWLTAAASPAVYTFIAQLSSRVMLRAVLLCCALPSLGVASWRDPPLAASSIFSLDGSDWSVTGEGRAFSQKCTGGASAGPDDGCCEYEQGVDFTAGPIDYDNGNGVTAIAYALDQSRCCELCAATAGCAASVWKTPPPRPPTPHPSGPPPPPSSECHFAKDIDFHPETTMEQLPAADEKACCGFCRGTVGCVAAVLYGGDCYLKAAMDVSGGNYSRSERIACVPTHDKCNTTVGYDIGPQTGGGGVGTEPAGTAADCCDMCSRTTGCVAAVFYQNQCYMKGAQGVVGGPYKRDDRVLVQPRKGTRELARPGTWDLKRPGLRATAGGACIFKTTADLASKVTNVSGSMACVPSGTKSTGLFTIPATVPGELLTDLQRAGKVLDPLSSNNHKAPDQVQWWNGDVYTYQKNFSVPASMHSAAEVLLVLDGVKMGSAVSLNGRDLGNTTNQHLRYTFEIGALLATNGENTLEISFIRDIPNSGRFMACSGGWDWAPYSRMRDVEGNPMLTRGIWKSVYLAAMSTNAAAIESLTPTILFKGEFPTAVLKDDGSHTFEVNVTAHLTAKQASGTLHVSGNWGASKSVSVELTAADRGHKAVSVLLEASGVKLWWPRGLGQQRMYNVTAVFEPSAPNSEGDAGGVTARRRIGFRVAYLTTGNDTDPEWVAAHKNGNGNAVPAHTLMFRINGAAMSMRGANMIPMETRASVSLSLSLSLFLTLLLTLSLSLSL